MKHRIYIKTVAEFDAALKDLATEEGYKKLDNFFIDAGKRVCSLKSLFEIAVMKKFNLVMGMWWMRLDIRERQNEERIKQSTRCSGQN